MRVTLDVFSGRPNPSWDLSSWHARELQARLSEKRVPPVHLERPMLGFRGLIVTAQHDEAGRRGLPVTFRLGAPVSAQTTAGAMTASAEPETRPVAQWLLRSAAPWVHPLLLAYAATQLQARSSLGPASAPEAALRAGPKITACLQSSPYNPEFWDDPGVQPFNNCYNFATNFRSDTTAQPGRLSGAQYSDFSCWNVGMAASFDGVGTACQFPSNFVALVIWPGVDFHWYRLQAEGFWAHKIGHGQVTNLDSGGQVIQGDWTPENCGRGPYTLFCGYRYAPAGMRVM